MMNRSWYKYSVIVALSAVICFIFFYILSLFLNNKGTFIATSYSQVAVVLLEDEKGLGYSELLASYELANSYLNYANDTYMFKKASKSLPEDLTRKYSYRELKNVINVEFMPDTFILKYIAEADNKEDAIKLCNFYSEFSLKETNELLKVGYYDIFEKAEDAKYKGKSYTYGFVGAVLGIAISSGLIYMNNRFSQRVRSASKLKEKFPELNILGVVGDINIDL